MRDIYQIAQEVKNDWKNVYFGAVPYLEAMESLTDMQSKYGQDSASSILSYFLANAATWRGEVAKRVKTEINMALKAYYKRNESKQIKSILTLLESSVIKESDFSKESIWFSFLNYVNNKISGKNVYPSSRLNDKTIDHMISLLTELKSSITTESGNRIIDEADEKDPCWDGYHKLGMKDKGGKQVPNCVKENKRKK